LFKLGVLVKYIPYPVTAGLLNGMAILLLMSQIRPILGLDLDSSIWAFEHIKFLTFVIGSITILTVAFAPKLRIRIPAPLLGMVAGAAMYYLFVLIGQGEHLGETLGTIPLTVPMPVYAPDFWALLSSSTIGKVLIEVTPMALGLATMASLKSLVVSVAADNLLRKRSDSNRELISQGFGNITSSLFGGLAVAGDQTGTTEMFQFGGSTVYARLIAGLVALAVVLFLGPVLSPIPRVVLAGILVIVALQGIDRWSLTLIPRLRERRERGQVFSDLIVVVLVTGIFVFIDILVAISIGGLISIVLFVVRMSKDIVRRNYNASRIRSNVYRPEKEIICLENTGDKIQVYELEGSLFFGTADRIANTIEDTLSENIDTIIVDLGHVSDVDSTGAQILLRIRDRCLAKDKQLLLSSLGLVRDNEVLLTILSASNSTPRPDQSDVFETIDDALARAEDWLLDEAFGVEREQHALSLNETDLLEGYSSQEIELLTGYLEQHEYDQGEVILNQGETGDRLCILIRGRVDVVIDLPEHGNKKKLLSLCAGTIFGEMAIIDRKPRSASVVATTTVTAMHLRDEALSKLRKDHPELDHRLSMGIASELSKRLRIANRVITEHKS
jgi:MFS superfamily sulfate permease-like transporter/CRP-like cAMP-binding protein